MARYQDESQLVPLEIGLQASETLLMWVAGAIFWLFSLVFMGFATGFGNLTLIGTLLFILGGLFMVGSQIVNTWDPMRTTRFPVLGLIVWLWTIVWVFPVMYTGFANYTEGGTGIIFFVILYVLLALLATAGLIVTFYLTEFKVLKWMNAPINSTLYVLGVISTLIGITHIGFNSPELLNIDEISFWTWVWLFLFGMSYLLFMELNHGAHSFNEIVTYAKKQSVGDFSLTPVINNYYYMGAILMVIIGATTLLVLIINWFLSIIMPYISEQMADSIMVNSVYHVVFTVAAIFIPLSIILILFFEFKNRTEEKEEEAMKKKAKKERTGS